MFSEPPLEYNNRPDAFDKSRVIMTFLTIFGVTEILCRLVIEKRGAKGIPESSKLEPLEKFLPNNFALSDAGNKSYGSLNREGIGDLLLLRTILAI